MTCSGNNLNLSPVHPFPARMAPSIIWNELPKGDNPICVLDPMSGSGTALVASRMRGHEAIGFDADPLAVLIARAWCADVDEPAARKKAEEVINRARSRYSSIRLGDAYPDDADEETREFVRYWFDEINRKELAALSRSISHVQDLALKDLLWCAFSRLIITKQSGASLAMDVSHSRPHRVYDNAPIKPFDKFIRSVNAVLNGSPFKEEVGAARARVNLGDARRLPLEDSSIDLIITSPPYLNAIDYLRGHKLSLVWMGFSIQQIREIRSASVGTESSKNTTCKKEFVDQTLKRMGEVESLPDRFRKMLKRYVLDMDKVLSEMHRVLKSEGRAILVVGDSSIRGTYVQNSKAIIHLGERNGFVLRSSRRRQLPESRRYLPPPNRRASGAQLQSRMREEVIIKFQKKTN